jgi:aspartate aminotransferase
MVELAGAKPVLVTCTEESNFKITPAMLEKAITPNTKAFLFCSPANPTGFVYSKEELKALADVIKKHPRIVVLTDDMYNRLMFDGSHCAPQILQVAPELRDRTVVINGGSKAYSMTGWRIGWAMGPQKVIQALGDYASQSTGAPSSISQYAAVQAITNCEANIKETNATLIKRMQAALQEFKAIPEFKVFEPNGAFYFWVDVKKALGKTYQGQKIVSSKDFCQVLLEKFYVATVPGEEFGNPGYMRLSFAIGSDRMAQAIQRMRKFINEMN